MELQYAKYDCPCSFGNYNDADRNSGFQLLLTRSKDLAQRLKLYTKRLINTRLGIIAEDQGGGGGNVGEDTTQDLLSLNDEDFPLVCTFDYFLRLLENLVKYFTIIPIVHLPENLICPLGSSPKRGGKPRETSITLLEWNTSPSSITGYRRCWGR